MYREQLFRSYDDCWMKIFFRSFMNKECVVIKLIGKLEVSHGQADNVLNDGSQVQPKL